MILINTCIHAETARSCPESKLLSLNLIIKLEMSYRNVQVAANFSQCTITDKLFSVVRCLRMGN